MVFYNKQPTFNLDNLSYNEKLELLQGLEMKEQNMKKYNLAYYKPISETQEELIQKVSDAVLGNTNIKLIWANGGNSSGKTACSSFMVSSLALGELTKEFGARFIGERKRIAIFVENFAGVRKIEEYMLKEPTMQDGSRHTGLARIPPEYISTIEYSNSVKPKAVRFVELINGTTIEFNTFGQGQSSAAGGNYDFVWMDEPPQNRETFEEIVSRGSRSHCVVMLSATLATEKSDYIAEFFDTLPKEMKEKTEIVTLLSKDNKYTDTDILQALGEHRLTGRKPEKKGKVYYQFDKGLHVVEHFEPTFENMGGYCRYFMGIDPGGGHAFAIVLFCMDEEGNIYIFKEFPLLGEDQAFGNVINIIGKECSKYNIEKIIVDMRDAYFIKTLKNDYDMRNVQKCDKHTRGPRGETNINWRRMRINEYFSKGKIMISDKCQTIIREFQTLKYKNNVDETMTAKSDIYGSNDDCIDAFGYAFDYATKHIGMNKITDGIFSFYNNKKKKTIDIISPKEEKWSEKKLHSLNMII